MIEPVWAWDFVHSIERVAGRAVDTALVEQRAEDGGDEPTTLFVASTDTPDRAMDIVRQDWRNLKGFLRNPVIFDNHDPRLVVGRATSAEVPRDGKDAGRLMIRVAWNTSSPSAEIARVGHDHLNGFRHAGSVGFRSGKKTKRSDLPKDHPGFQEPVEVETWWGGTAMVAGTLFERNELLEFSSASIPMNPEALQRSLGILTPDLRQKTGDFDLLAALADPATAAAVVRCLLPSLLDAERASPEVAAERARLTLDVLRGADARRIVSAYADAAPAKPTPEPVDLLTLVALRMEPG